MLLQKSSDIVPLVQSFLQQHLKGIVTDKTHKPLQKANSFLYESLYVYACARFPEEIDILRKTNVQLHAFVIFFLLRGLNNHDNNGLNK